MQMRSMGMAVERVKSVKVLLASGEVVVADKDNHGDLFWAMLGGGGGTFGIALEFILKVAPLPNSAMLFLDCKFWVKVRGEEMLMIDREGIYRRHSIPSRQTLP